MVLRSMRCCCSCQSRQRPLRRWQERAVRRFHALDAPDFLGVATPGGGKTVFVLKCAHDLLSDGKVERVVVAAPTEHLKRQWAEAAAAVGKDIDPAWSNSDGCEASDYFGAAVTYQQVSFAPDLYDLNCRRRTLVVFDEVHHAGDNLDWGIKLRAAFRRAAYRLSVSGTPFRNDDQQRLAVRRRILESEHAKLYRSAFVRSPPVRHDFRRHQVLAGRTRRGVANRQGTRRLLTARAGRGNFAARRRQRQRYRRAFGFLSRGE